MAAVNPQGSRAGLITAVVVFVVLFVTSTIFAIYFNAQYTKAALSAEQERSKASTIVNEVDAGNPEVAHYIQVAKKPDAAFNVVLRERALLCKYIAPSATPTMPTAQAETAAVDALKYAQQRLTDGKVQGVSVAGDLSTTIHTLADAVVTQSAEKAKAMDQAKAAAEGAAKVTAERDSLLKAKDDEIAKATADKDKAVAEIEEWRKAKGTDITQIQTDADQKLKDLQAVLDKQQLESNKKDARIKELVKSDEGKTNRLRSTRINPNESIIQHADGKIIRIPSNNTVFINIGQQQSVTLGLTFEVYDKDKGIPALGNGMRDADLPAGKASIEVIHVLPTSSECRVVHKALGQAITEGDLIMNLVFDPNTHYKFVVYGDFDLSNTGTANPQDADVVKRLITQWGGRITPNVTVDADFVVMGLQPVVPVLSKDDENSPPAVQKRDALQAAQDAYLDVQAKAVALGIPIMNQNRFLYFIGYYDQATR